MNSVLEAMKAELGQAPRLYQPSNFWLNLGKIHEEQLSQSGLANFKRTVNLNYFDWRIIKILAHQISPVLSEFVQGNFAPLTQGRLEREDRFWPKLIYKTYVAALFDYVRRKDALRILNQVMEPKFGHPLGVYYRGKFISQDLCNSVHEFYSIFNMIDTKRSDNLRVGEIGAGYGRLAYIFLKTLPGVTYTIIDIPPALFIAQEYLSRIFRKEKIFHFRPFKSFSRVRKEFNASRIRFLMPHQIENLPHGTFDLLVSVSSLHEMTRDQIDNYFRQIDRLGREGYFYSKQWLRSRTRDNDFIERNEYTVPRRWKVLYNRVHPIQRLFFEALYKL